MTARVLRLGRWRIQRELARDRAATYYAAARATGERATLCVPSDAWLVCEGAPRALARVLALHRTIAAGFVRFVDVDRDDHDEAFLIAEPVAPALQALRGARPDPGQTRQLALALAATLAAAHARGIAHGDLDLDHVLWAAGHAPRILGLGASLESAAQPGADALALGRVLCTLIARWPSQLVHTTADHRLRMLACRLADPASGLALHDAHDALAADATTAMPEPDADATRDYDSASTLTSAPPFEAPLDDAQLGRYRLRARLGHGGMGEVVLAEDPALRRGVAIKRIRPGFERDPTYRARLRREAQLAARLCHRAIVQVFDLITTDDVDHVVMEYVAGPSLATLLAGEAMPVPDAVRIAAELADGLDYAHRQGVLHRDLKLENVLLGLDGQAKIADFGIARRLPSPDLATQSAPLTRENMTIGTARAMSPEQIQGGELDARSDLFSFGVLLYELLTGVSPFVSSVYLETFQRVLAHRPPPVRELVPSIPEPLSALVASMLEKAPAARPKNAAEVRDRLRDLASHALDAAPPTAAANHAPRVGEAARPHGRPWRSLAAKMQAPFILAEIRALRASVFKKAPEIQAALAIAEQIEHAHDLHRADLFLSALDTFCAILAPFATTVLTGTLRRIGYEIFPQYVSILGYAAPDVRRAMNLAAPTDLVRVICRAYNECVIGADAGTLAPTIAGATATVVDTTFMPCQLQMGVFLGAGLLTGLFREASLTERRCRARGDAACVYDFAF